MTGDSSIFASLTRIKGGNATFGDNSKGNIIGLGNIVSNSSLLIENIFLVSNLKHNLLSISQLCNKGYKSLFEPLNCKILDSKDNLIYLGHRKANIYTIDISQSTNKNFFMANDNNNQWLWHRRLGHANMKLISKLAKLNLVYGLPNLNFEKG